jgi:phospholipid-transporting ATPase
MANLYFLILTLMELYKPISDSGGQPVLALPLTFVVVVSMVKDGYEDCNRSKSDKEENSRDAHYCERGAQTFECQQSK